MKTGILFAFLFTTFLNLSVQEKEMSKTETAAFTQRLREVSKSTKSIECNFTLKKFMALTTQPVESSGKFYYSAPDKVRWEETAPQPYQLIVAGDSIYSSNKANYKNSKHLQGIKDLMLGSANGTMLESSQFEKTFFTNGAGSTVKLRPTVGMMKKIFSNIELLFDTKTLRLQTIRLNEPGGDYTLISFFDTKFDQPLAAGIFAIKK